MSILLYSAGFVLFGVAIWRSGALPRWAGLLIAVHAPLITGPVPLVGSVAGMLFALAGGGWIAFSVLRDTPGRTESRTTPRAGRASSREI